MLPFEIWFAYSVACLLLVLSPGPDNLLAIGCGFRQGKRAAMGSGVALGAGILFHVAAATFGLTLLMQASALVFWGGQADRGCLFALARDVDGNRVGLHAYN